MFWFNGVTWIKSGGTGDQSITTVWIETSRYGSNDVVIFQFVEADLTGQSLIGEIFDINGIKVATLDPGPNPNQTLIWDGKKDNGSSVPAGVTELAIIFILISRHVFSWWRGGRTA